MVCSSRLYFEAYNTIRQAVHVLNFEAPLPNLPPKMPIPTYIYPSSVNAQHLQAQHLLVLMLLDLPNLSLYQVVLTLTLHNPTHLQLFCIHIKLICNVYFNMQPILVLEDKHCCACTGSGILIF